VSGASWSVAGWIPGLGLGLVSVEGLDQLVRLDSGRWMRYILKGPIVCPQRVVEGVPWKRLAGRSDMLRS
jgi:hypothetical protein